MPRFGGRIPEEPLQVLVFGAHFDDCEIRFGGTATKYRELGHDVTLVCMTDGVAGHHEQGGATLGRRRRAEAEAASDVIGSEYVTLDKPEGELRPTLENRNDVIELVREVEPDVVFTHRPNDYHPDHRYTAELVRDAAYMVTVPHICPQTDHLSYNPVICYLPDDFEKPYPLDADVVVDIDDVWETKMDMVHQYTSQMYEWLPYNLGILDEVPDDEAARREWLPNRYAPRNRDLADRFREELVEEYGEERGRNVEFAEAFEHCEYGGDLTEENRDALFPFL
jgi:LmbE family N-acetylglucosaminyl deacetylase